MKRSDKSLHFIIESTTEIKKQIYRRALHDHRLTIAEAETLKILDQAKRNACINLNQNKMRKWGK